MQYYLENLYSVGTERPKYKLSDEKLVKQATGKRAFKYGFPQEPVTLVPEPNNPHDKNAIQVLLCGVLIGYVPADLCGQVKQILKKNQIQRLNIFIDGGDYKEINGNTVTLVSKPITGQVGICYV